MEPATTADHNISHRLPFKQRKWYGEGEGKREQVHSDNDASEVDILGHFGTFQDNLDIFGHFRTFSDNSEDFMMSLKHLD